MAAEARIQEARFGAGFCQWANTLPSPLAKVVRRKARLFAPGGPRVRGVNNYTRGKFYSPKNEADNR